MAYLSWLPVSEEEDKRIELSWLVERLRLYVGGSRPQMDVRIVVEKGLRYPLRPDDSDLDRYFLIFSIAAAWEAGDKLLARRCYNLLRPRPLLPTANPTHDPEVWKYLHYDDRELGITLYMWFAGMLYRLYHAVRH